MKTIEIKKIKDCNNYIGKNPKKEDYDILITEPTLFTMNGEIVAFYDKLPDNLIKKAEEVSINTKSSKSWRQGSGVPTMSSVFGALPKNEARRMHSCRPAKKNTKELNNFKTILTIAEKIAKLYQSKMPNNYEEDLKTIKEIVNKDYLIKNLPFTTFNANKNQIIRYHRDRGNVKGVMSNVLISRYGVSGGELVFPEYRFALAQENGFYSVFNGEKEIHGVADCQFLAQDAYRCSFVFYTLEQMKHCKSYFEEMKSEKETFTQKNINRKKTFGMSKKEFSKGDWKK